MPCAASVPTAAQLFLPFPGFFTASLRNRLDCFFLPAVLAWPARDLSLTVLFLWSNPQGSVLGLVKSQGQDSSEASSSNGFEQGLEPAGWGVGWGTELERSREHGYCPRSGGWAPSFQLGNFFFSFKNVLR